MKRLVMKFGGKALANAHNMRLAVRHILREHHKGTQVIVVASAMEGQTNALIEKLYGITPNPSPREYAVVVSSGEQVAAGLLAAMLEESGVSAISQMGWQLPILTTTTHQCSDITHLATEKLEALLQTGSIPVVAGFQGITAKGEITTLGRGGTDLTAVALSSYLKADACHLYKDVDGIYTADPHLLQEARRLMRVDYGDLLRLSRLGARIVALKAVEWAMKQQVPLEIFSFLEEESKGTRVCSLPNTTQTMRAILTRRQDGEKTLLYILGAPASLQLEQFPVQLLAHSEHVIEVSVANEQVIEVAQRLHAALWEETPCTSLAAS